MLDELLDDDLLDRGCYTARIVEDVTGAARHIVAAVLLDGDDVGTAWVVEKRRRDDEAWPEWPASWWASRGLTEHLQEMLHRERQIAFTEIVVAVREAADRRALWAPRGELLG